MNAGEHALDFAGGNVVHINAGIAGLVACIMVGKRKGFPGPSLVPHNVPFVLIGAALLWVGWFGFNAGSAASAGYDAGLAMLVTQIAAATGNIANFGIAGALILGDHSIPELTATNFSNMHANPSKFVVFPMLLSFDTQTHALEQLRCRRQALCSGLGGHARCSGITEAHDRLASTTSDHRCGWSGRCSAHSDSAYSAE